MDLGLVSVRLSCRFAVSQSGRFLLKGLKVRTEHSSTSAYFWVSFKSFFFFFYCGRPHRPVSVSEAERRVLTWGLCRSRSCRL